MKATIKFNLNSPDEQKAHLCCLFSTNMANVLWELHNNGYKKLKKDRKPTYNKGVSDTLEYLKTLLEEGSIDINELTG